MTPNLQALQVVHWLYRGDGHNAWVKKKGTYSLVRPQRAALHDCNPV